MSSHEIPPVLNGKSGNVWSGCGMSSSGEFPHGCMGFRFPRPVLHPHAVRFLGEPLFSPGPDKLKAALAVSQWIELEGLSIPSSSKDDEKGGVLADAAINQQRISADERFIPTRVCFLFRWANTQR